MLEIYLLGRFQVRHDGEVVDISSHQARCLLAYLSMKAGTSYRREKLAGTFWPEADETNARNSLRKALWLLRATVGGEYFIADRNAIAFNPNAPYRLDVADLEETSLGTRSEEESAQALAMYTGELMPGFYDEWVVQERERILDVYERSVQSLLEGLVEEGRWKGVLKWAEHWITHAYAPEPAFRALMTAYAGMDDLSSMAKAYRRCYQALSEDIGVEPSEETKTLYERLSRGGKPASPRDMRPTHNLPAQLSPFVGREAELTLIGERLASPECRLLTLVGPGGIGKTRLALQAASAQVGSFSNGVFFVPLSPVIALELIVPTIAESIGFELFGGENPQVQLLDFLREKQILLVMDNLEHLMDGVMVVGDILRQAPGVKILATSRERLNLQGEWLLEIRGFPIPEGGEVETQSAARLLVQSARRIQPDFKLTEADREAVLQICDLVGGMPLGIELAAAWVRLLSCEEIAREIQKSIDFLTTSARDVPERHRSLRAVFDSSWDLLRPGEREVFKRLMVFRGGFQREMAEAVAGTTLAMLSALVDKSYLQRGESGRYELHGLLRAYGLGKLAEDGQASEAVMARHAEVFLEYLAGWLDSLRGPGKERALKAISVEMENVRSAWDHALERGHLSWISRSLESLWLYYDHRSRFQEGLEVFGRTVKALEDPGWNSEEVEPVIARALARQGWFAWRLGHYRRARELGESCLSLVEKGGLSAEGAFSFNLLGIVAYALGEFKAARDSLQRSLALWRDVDEPWGEAIALLNLGLVAHTLGEYGEALQPYQEGLAIFKEVGYLSGATFAFDSLGRVAREVGELTEARDLYLESLTIRRQLGDPWGIAASLDGLAAVECGLGEYEKALEACRESHEIRRSLQDPRGLATSFYNLSVVSYMLGEYDGARELCEQGLALRRTLGDRRGIAASLSHLGNIAYLLEDYPASVGFDQESLVIRRALGDRRGVVISLNNLGMATLALSDFEQAEQDFREALKEAMDIGAAPLALEAILGLVDLIARDGDIERSCELVALVIHHPASDEDLQDRAREVLSGLASRVPPEVVTQAWDRGMALSLEAVAARMLARGPRGQSPS